MLKLGKKGITKIELRRSCRLGIILYYIILYYFNYNNNEADAPNSHSRNQPTLQNKAPTSETKKSD